jgi:chaperonin GroES
MTKCDLIPMEFNVVVELDPVEEKTASGLYLPETKVNRDKLEAEEGTLVALSPHAFTYADWPEGSRKPQVGDRVLIARFAGIQRDRDGTSLKIVKDKDIIAVVVDPETEAREQAYRDFNRTVDIVKLAHGGRV